jgi:soluble lytic murein transglycosylase-like protein
MRAGGITPSGAWPSFSFPAWPSQQAQRTPLLPSPRRLRTVAGDPHAAFVTEASQRFGIPEHWIVAVKRAESAGDVRAISSAGALG